MRILVTGGAGFIGSHFVKCAARAGHVVAVLDALTYAGSRANLDVQACSMFYQGRVEVPGQVRKCLEAVKPDAVAHFAAETHVTRSINSPSAFMKTNAVGTYVLLDQCVKYRDGGATHLRVLNVSTDEVYGSLAEGEAPWTEDSPHAPNNPYAASKAAADHLSQAYFHTYGLQVITTHSSNNYGSHQHPEKLIPTLARQLLRRQPLTLHGDGQHIRDWIHVEDHCDGLLRTLVFGKPGSTINFSGGNERTNLEVAQFLLDKFHRLDSGVKFTLDRPGNDRRYAMSHVGARRIGWTAFRQLEDHLPAVIQWYLDNPTYESRYGK